MMFTEKRLLWLIAVCCGLGSPLRGTPPSALFVAAAGNVSSKESNYQCGAYSLATPLNRYISDDIYQRFFSDTNATSAEEITLSGYLQDELEFQVPNQALFVAADISCAFNPDRVIFDNDYLRRNNKGQDMVWDPETIVSNGDNIPTILPPALPNISEQLDEESEEDYMGISLDIPKNIQIRIYAIGDDLGFRYRSNPLDIVTPLYGLQTVEFGKWSFANATLLEFVWDRTAIRKLRKAYHRGPILSQIFHPEIDATLELWIPNKILERTTILGPKYDYSLAIEVDGDLIDTTESEGANKTDTEISEDNVSRRLLTKRPPQNLTVWNDGIGTQVMVSMNASSFDSTTRQSQMELNFIDRSLNGVVEIRTDSGVHGLVQLNGSNTRACVFSEAVPPDNEASSSAMEIEAIGFRQVLTVRGEHETVSLSGISIALYTTEMCPAVENGTACATVASNFTGQSAPKVETHNGTMMDIFDFLGVGLEPLPAFVQLADSCLVSTEFSPYNCNPLSSGAVVLGPGIVSFVVIAGASLAWSVLEVLVI